VPCVLCARYKRDPPRFLKAGDVVEVSIEGLGTLKNFVAVEGDFGTQLQ
jgi:2-keto-4-pentenoate hydratase/2-oxohepta-3-ene-1,7-dioic acid hydratase in catechol pathway